MDARCGLWLVAAAFGVAIGDGAVKTPNFPPLGEPASANFSLPGFFDSPFARLNSSLPIDGTAREVATISRGMPIARAALGAELRPNRCAALFNLPTGKTPLSLLNQVHLVFEDIHDPNLYAEEFDPSDPGNPNPGRYTVIFNPDVKGGPNEAADTIVHELIHVAFGMSNGNWVRGALNLGWVNADGGADPSSQTAETKNNTIVQRNCFPAASPTS